MTIIGGGYALGNHVPPYYVFPGKRWNSEFLENAAQGSDKEMSSTGLPISDLFNNYLTSILLNMLASQINKVNRRL